MPADPYRFGRGKLPNVVETDQGATVILENTAGLEIDPATEQTLSAVADALVSAGNDTLRTEQQTPVGVEDSGGMQVDPATEQTLSAVAAALASNGTDTLQTEQQTPVGVENSAGTQVDPATEPTLSAIAGALASNATDTLQTEQQTPVGVEDSTGTQVDPATEPTLSAIAGALASNATDSVLVDSNAALDVSAATVTTDPNDGDEGAANGAALSSNGTVTVASLSAVGGESIHGQVKSSGSYDVVIDWKDSAGNVIRSETIASAVTGGNWTSINQDAKAAYADVIVADASAASQTVNGTAHMG